MTKIDDAAVDRAMWELNSGKWTNRWASREAVRAALEAALSPDPEIQVSEGMRRAGEDMFRKYRAFPLPTDRDETRAGDIAEIIYRAMESTRRKEAGETPIRLYGHIRATDRLNPDHIVFERRHRRKDDQ